MAPKRPKKVVRRVSPQRPRPSHAKSRKLRPFVRPLLRLVLLMLAWGALGYGLLMGYHRVVTSPYFEIARTEVHGNHYLDRKTILKQAQIEMPANLLAVNLALVRKRLLAHPWIEDAHVSRTIPNLLELRVVEQQPIAVVKADRYYLINRWGVAFAYAGTPAAFPLPIVEGLPVQDLGVVREAPGTCMTAVLGLLEAARASTWLSAYPRIHVDPHVGLTLVEKSSAHRVLLGFDHFDKKLVLLGKVRGYLKRQHAQKKIALIDVTQLDRVVVQSKPALTGTALSKEV